MSTAAQKEKERKARHLKYTYQKIEEAARSFAVALDAEREAVVALTKLAGYILSEQTAMERAAELSEDGSGNGPQEGGNEAENGAAAPC